jgi:hypothetical protein
MQSVVLTLADEYQSQGNSFFGKGGRNNKRSQLRYILRLFRSLLSIRDDRVQMDLCDQGIIPSITGKNTHLSVFNVDRSIDRLPSTDHSTEIHSDGLCRSGHHLRWTIYPHVCV